MKNLVIVESPAKAKTIEKYLGKDFKVLSSVGHIRQIPPKDNNAIDVDHDFATKYEVSPDKKKVVTELLNGSLLLPQELCDLVQLLTALRGAQAVFQLLLLEIRFLVHEQVF